MWSYFHWRDWLWHPLRLIRHGSHGFAFKGHHKLSGLAIWAENPWMCAIILIFLINFEDTEVVSANHSIFKTFCLLAILGLPGMWSENSKEWALVRQRLVRVPNLYFGSFSSWNPERRPERFQFLSTYTSALPNEGCGSSQSQILLFFGYCTPNCIQYSWGTWLASTPPGSSW